MFVGYAFQSLLTMRYTTKCGYMSFQLSVATLERYAA